MRLVMGFEEVSLKHTKRGKCAVCGKNCQQTETFSQTINPYNLDKYGRVKFRDVIMNENKEKRDAWRTIPPKCKNCR